jgi:hypothetical protein
MVGKRLGTVADILQKMGVKDSHELQVPDFVDPLLHIAPLLPIRYCAGSNTRCNYGRVRAGVWWPWDMPHTMHDWVPVHMQPTRKVMTFLCARPGLENYGKTVTVFMKQYKQKLPRVAANDSESDSESDDDDALLTDYDDEFDDDGDDDVGTPEKLRSKTADECLEELEVLLTTTKST